MAKQDLLECARATGNPVIEGGSVTFVWEGGTAPQLIDDLHGWEEHPQELQPVAPGLWAFSFDLARDAYLEYAFYDPQSKQRQRDPLNPNRIWNGLGNYNHFVYMPDVTPTPLARLQRGAPRGRLTRHLTPTWMLSGKGKRAVQLYQPPSDEPVPLLVVYDGNDYLQRARLAVMLDNLIAEGRMRPLAAAFLYNGGARRFVEYACSEATLAWLDHEVLPLARERLNLLDVKQHPGAFGVLGASMGGLMSLYSGLRLPQVFGKVLSQSGAFHFEQFDTVTVEMVEHFPPRPLRIWLEAGKMEWLLESNRKMHALLQEKKYDVTYREYNGGHNYTSWRDDLWRGLVHLFG
jgi:enterochelin esterase-like enzyme